jgi:hypothetical protein
MWMGGEEMVREMKGMDRRVDGRVAELVSQLPNGINEDLPRTRKCRTHQAAIMS